MNKILFSVGTLIAGCFTLTSCSGGGEGNAEQSVGAMAGRTFILESPNSITGAMYIKVGDRIAGRTCDATFYFGKPGTPSSGGRVTIEDASRDGDGWKTCDFTFHIDEGEISEQVEFKMYFSYFLADVGTTTNGDTEGGEDDGQQNTGGSMNADDYVSGIPQTLIKMQFDNSSEGSYMMEDITLWLDDDEAPVSYSIPSARFRVHQ